MIPVHPSKGVLSPLGIDKVRLTGGFWGDLQDRNAAAILPHCTDWVARSGAVDNLRGSPRRGREFADSDVYKLLEALSWESGRRGGDPELDCVVDSWAGVLADAQQPDGYLNSLFATARYTDLEWGHELYCYGHLIQAGVARLRCGVQDKLTEVACRAADHVCVAFGPGGNDGVCGHPVIETALVELYRVTGERRYLDQARLFVERRGHGRLADIEWGRGYYQDDVPVRDRRAFAGHAVREFYFACGAVDVAVETGDDGLLAAIIDQWRNTAMSRIYLTGATGSRHNGESFGLDFELPPDRAYGETCAAIGAVLLSWRLLLATGQPRFADFIERTLFNAVASCPSRDGLTFFYSNPLQVREPGVPPPGDRALPRSWAGLRAPWFDVSCCPPNLARLLASLAAYQVTSDADGVQLHQLWPASMSTPSGELSVETGYPWTGSVLIRVESTVEQEWTLSVRVPEWAVGARLDGRDVSPGYAKLRRVWRAGDVVRLELPMAARWTWPDPRIDAVRACVAVERGPLVYCVESATPESFEADPNVPPVETPSPELGAEVVGLTVVGVLTEVASARWPYGPRPARSGRAQQRTLVPYALWGNRGPAAMRVFLPAVPDGLPAVPDALPVMPDGLPVMLDGLPVLPDGMAG